MLPAALSLPHSSQPRTKYLQTIIIIKAQTCKLGNRFTSLYSRQRVLSLEFGISSISAQWMTANVPLVCWRLPTTKQPWHSADRPNLWLLFCSLPLSLWLQAICRTQTASLFPHRGSTLTIANAALHFGYISGKEPVGNVRSKTAQKKKKNKGRTGGGRGKTRTGVSSWILKQSVRWQIAFQQISILPLLRAKLGFLS